MTSEPPANVLILTLKHRFYVDILLKPHVLHSSSAFTSAPFLGQNKYICERFGVHVGNMDSRGPSDDLSRRVENPLIAGFVEIQHESKPWAWSGKTTEGQASPSDCHKTAKMMSDENFQ